MKGVICGLCLLVAHVFCEEFACGIPSEHSDVKYVDGKLVLRKRPRPFYWPFLFKRSSDPSGGFSERILQGFDAPQHSLPWMAFLVSINGNGTRGTACGGSIISKKHILTAAHCLSFPNGSYAQLGTWIRADKNEKWRKGKFILHEDYNAKEHNNDIALFELDEEIEFTENIRPICLPDKGMNFQKSRQSVLASGWGSVDPMKCLDNHCNKTDEGIPAEVLQEIIVDTYPMDSCKIFIHNLDASTKMCTYSGKAMGQGVCSGDSGSPILAFIKEKQAYVVAGIAAFVKPFIYVCGMLPDFHTHVPNYVD